MFCNVTCPLQTKHSAFSVCNKIRLPCYKFRTVLCGVFESFFKKMFTIFILSKFFQSKIYKTKYHLESLQFNLLNAITFFKRKCSFVAMLSTISSEPETFTSFVGSYPTFGNFVKTSFNISGFYMHLLTVCETFEQPVVARPGRFWRFAANVKHMSARSTDLKQLLRSCLLLRWRTELKRSRWKFCGRLPED